jgi:hypothetical protein
MIAVIGAEPKLSRATGHAHLSSLLASEPIDERVRYEEGPGDMPRGLHIVCGRRRIDGSSQRASRIVLAEILVTAAGVDFKQ